MASNQDKVKQKLQEERDKVDALNQEIARYNLEEERKKNASKSNEGSSPEPSQNPDEAQFKVKPSPIAEEDWKKILQDYMEQYPEHPVQNDTLKFPSRDDAINFFTAQATNTPPRKFFLSEHSRVDGKPTGFHVFSCGDGVLYKGTINEIQTDLKAALKANPNDPNLKEGLETINKFANPAQDFKGRLQSTKEEVTSASNEENNPLETKPSM